MKNPTERFTQTVQDYIKYRPSYPQKSVDVLVNECGLTPHTIIADVGSGTGILSKLFLDYGNVVYGVEPNQPMREAAQAYLKDYPNFHSVNGTAEATALPNQSVDIITVGTAFHWFNALKTKVEFQRLLKPHGWVLLVWNVRDGSSRFMQEYEQLILKYGTDYRDSNAQRFDQTALDHFFEPATLKTSSFRNAQSFDWDGLQGRLSSASYSLRPGDPLFNDMKQALKNLYDTYQRRGAVEFLYQTKMYYGRL